MRYGEDLRIVFSTPVTQFSLPSLTLEPIVENAVRHGGVAVDDRRVELSIREEGGRMYIAVTESHNITG